MQVLYSPLSEHMKQAHIFIEGFVQGVGFRQFVKNKALKRGLFGWVRNLPDGRVEALLQGDKTNIETVIMLCRKGPFTASVENVEVLWEDSDTQYSSFETT